MELRNKSRIVGLIVGSQVFDSFGVHLVLDSGIKFVKMIILDAKNLLEFINVDLEEVKPGADESNKEIEVI